MAKTKMLKTLRKPQPRARSPILDYGECEDYINAKYGVEIRNFAGKTFYKDDEVPYQDFWHFLCDSSDIRNGADFYMPQTCKYNEDWQNQVLKMFYDEFANGNYEADLKFNVVW